tara:strand:+ start:1020 stop:1241 length:222 start_codon:yes stop_codon:yes gene_type:complete
MNWVVEFGDTLKPALDCQVDAAVECIRSQKDICFSITDPVSNKSFKSTCKYISEKQVIFINQETETQRNAYLV